VAQIALFLALLSLFSEQNMTSRAPSPAHNRYAVLNDEDFGTEPDTMDHASEYTAQPTEPAALPWQPTAFDQPTPRGASRPMTCEHTPAPPARHTPAAVTPAPSNTPVSPMRYVPQHENFEYNGAVYGTLAGAIHASRQDTRVPAHLVDWVGTVAEAITQYHTSAINNTLAEKFNNFLRDNNERFEALNNSIGQTDARHNSLVDMYNSFIDRYNDAADEHNTGIEHVNTALW
jgi:hypothetical protein